MTPKKFYRSAQKPHVEEVCKAAGTSLGNFKQIALSGGSCGKRLAEKLAQASRGAMTELEILYPERYES